MRRIYKVFPATSLVAGEYNLEKQKLSWWDKFPTSSTPEALLQEGFIVATSSEEVAKELHQKCGGVLMECF